MKTAWPIRKLAEVIEVVSGQVDPTVAPYCDLPHVGGDNIESNSGRLTNLRTAAELRLTSGKYSFDETHVLYSKIRPVLNKVALPGFRGICSADIYPIKPKDGHLTREFLVYLLRSDDFLQYTERYSNRANIPKLNREALLAYESPLPPLAEQKQIAAILDKADAIRRRRQEAASETAQLSNSLFMSMFAGMLKKTLPLGSFTEEMRYGTSVKSASEGKPTLRIPNIISSEINLEDLKTVPVEPSEFARLRLEADDMLFVRTNGNPDYIGRCAVFEPALISEAGHNPDEFTYASYLIRVRLQQDKLDPVFARCFLETPAGRQALRENCRTTAGQYNISTQGLGALPIPCVALADQRLFRTRVQAIRRVRRRMDATKQAANAMFGSLVQRAFRGDL